MARLLEVKNLITRFYTIVGVVKSVDDVSYYLMKTKLSALPEKKIAVRPLSA